MRKGYVIKYEDVVETIKKVLNNFSEVKLAYIFGSIASRGYSTHDIDIAVLIESNDKLITLSKILEELATNLEISEDNIDLIDIDHAKPQIKLKVLQNGIKLIDRNGYEKKIFEKY